jgi:hypothetical protein
LARDVCHFTIVIIQHKRSCSRHHKVIGQKVYVVKEQFIATSLSIAGAIRDSWVNHPG